jgi:hypothetical protein
LIAATPSGDCRNAAMSDGRIGDDGVEETDIGRINNKD